MAALTKSKNVPELADGARQFAYPIEAATIVYLGSMVALNANGNAVPASVSTAIKIVGRAERVLNGIPGVDGANIAGAGTAPNPPNLGAAGAISIVARRGVFKYDNATGADAVGVADIGNLAYAIDDETVSRNNGAGGTTVVSQSVTFDASTTPQIMPLGHENVQVGSVVVKNSAGTVTYVEGTDYVIDYQGGLIALPSAGSGIAAGASVNVTYNWGAATRTVAGKIIGLDGAGVWVDFWHKA